MTDASALYVGRVTHQRVRTFGHRLDYRVWMLLLDLDTVEATQARLKLLSRGRFGLIGWCAADHGDRSGRPLRTQIEGHLDEAGIDLAGGPIRLLTMPRILGYGFNPISVWFCHRPDGQIAALLYEVTNTFHERHTYLVATPDPPPPGGGGPRSGGGGGAGALHQTAPKRFFVSPFMDMNLTYDFTVRPPGEDVSVTVVVRRGADPVLTARFSGQRRPLTDGQLLRAFLTHPLLTWKVMAGIHWEALKVMIKGAKYRHRPPPPQQPVTVGAPRF